VVRVVNLILPGLEVRAEIGDQSGKAENARHLLLRFVQQKRLRFYSRGRLRKQEQRPCEQKDSGPHFPKVLGNLPVTSELMNLSPSVVSVERAAAILKKMSD